MTDDVFPFPAFAVRYANAYSSTNGGMSLLSLCVKIRHDFCTDFH